MHVNPYEIATLGSDIALVRKIYSDFFESLRPADWENPIQNGDHEWNLREVVAHLGSLTQLGQDCLIAALRREPAPIPQDMSRYDFNRFNLDEIEKRLHMPVERLQADLLEALSQSIRTAGSLEPGDLKRTVRLPIYNRPIRVDELLGIQVVHPGLTHAAQITEPVGAEPLWTYLPDVVRWRVIGRMTRALSLLYRTDLAEDLRAVIAFQVAGEGGGSWRLDLSPESPNSIPGDVERPTLSWWFRDTSTFCRMFTGRLNPLTGLLFGRMRLRGDLRLFLRFKSFFSMDAPSKGE